MAGADSSNVESASFDFGRVLSGDRGLVLSHEFPLVNRADRPMRILHASALMPCCSTLDGVPASIAAGQSARIRASFRPGSSTGRRRLGFEVATDADSGRIHRFLLEANLAPEFELRGDPGTDTVNAVNRPGRSRLEVVCRMLRGEGRELPSSVDTDAPVRATFEGPGAECELEGGLIERTRGILVDWPATKVPGHELSRLRLVWDDGRTSEHALVRVVEPRISPSPSAFVWRVGGPATGVLLLRSEEPFRILGIEGPVEMASRSPEDGPSRLHRVGLAFRPTAGLAPETTNIVVRTDDPDQPSVAVTLLVLPLARGVEP